MKYILILCLLATLPVHGQLHMTTKDTVPGNPQLVRIGIQGTTSLKGPLLTRYILLWYGEGPLDTAIASKTAEQKHLWAMTHTKNGVPLLLDEYHCYDTIIFGPPLQCIQHVQKTLAAKAP